MEQTKEEEFWNTLTHFIGLLLSLGGLPVLMYYNQSQTALSSYSILFFGFGLILLYAASTVYHFTSNFKLKEKIRKYLYGETYGSEDPRHRGNWNELFNINTIHGSYINKTSLPSREDPMESMSQNADSEEVPDLEGF